MNAELILYVEETMQAIQGSLFCFLRYELGAELGTVAT